MCSNTQAKDPTVSFHRFSRYPALRSAWLDVFELQESDLKPSSRVCSRHFPEGDIKKMPSMTVGKSKCYAMSTTFSSPRYLCLGKRFASPIKPGARAARAKTRAIEKFVREHSSTQLTSSSRSVTPVVSTEEPVTSKEPGAVLQPNHQAP